MAALLCTGTQLPDLDWLLVNSCLADAASWQLEVTCCHACWTQSLHSNSIAWLCHDHLAPAHGCKKRTLQEACRLDNPAVGSGCGDAEGSRASRVDKTCCSSERAQYIHWAAGLLAPLAAGGTVIIPAGGKFSAGTFWRDATEHGATYYTAVPTMHQVSGGCVSWGLSQH